MDNQPKQKESTRYLSSSQRIEFLKGVSWSLAHEDIKNLWQWIKQDKIEFRDFEAYLQFLAKK